MISFLDFEDANGCIDPFTNQYSPTSNRNACRPVKTSGEFSSISFILSAISCVALNFECGDAICQLFCRFMVVEDS